MVRQSGVTRMNKWYRIFCLTLFFMLVAGSVAAHGCYTVIDSATGETVYQTAWPMQENDEFLTSDNRRYRIRQIDGQTAKAELLEIVKLSVRLTIPDEVATHGFLKSAYAASEKPLIGVYHTHNDESYIQSDGEESNDRGEGGILKVGDAFSEALEANGLQVIHAVDNHIPHDNMAYERSRRTAAKLVKQHPAAIFDLHRDATPPEAYQGQIDGEAVTKVQLVVGKYGPTGKQIEDYAMQMKAVADEEYPGLVKGIFFAKGGDYNQDLHTHSMLLEVGSHTNDRQQAERGVALFANVVPKVLGIKSAEAAPNATGNTAAKAVGDGAGAMKAAMYLLLLVLGGTIIYTYISVGSVQEAKEKMHHFMTKEFQDVWSFKNNKDKK